MSLLRSLPSSLPSSLGASSLAPAALPWENAGGGTSQTALLASLVTSLSGEWWDRRANITITGSGVSSWKGKITLADMVQGTDAKRPTYSATTGLSFTNAAASGLVGAANFLQGKPGYTVWLCGNTAAPTTQYYWAYGTGTNDAAMLNSIGTLVAYMRKSAGVVNQWNSALTTPFVHGVYMAQGQWADGVTAQKILTLNAATQGGSRTSAGDQTGGSFGAASMSVGCYVDGTSSMDGTIQHVIVVPSQVAASVDTQISTLLHGIEGF